MNSMIFGVIIIIIFPYTVGFALEPLSAYITKKIRNYVAGDDPIRWVTESSKNEMYVSSWNGIPKNDEGIFKDFLAQEFGIDWVKTAKIEKIDSKTIKVDAEKNSLSLRLNDKETEATLEIDDGRSIIFIAKTKCNKLDIYYECKGLPKLANSLLYPHEGRRLPKPAIENIFCKAYDTFGYRLRDNLWFYQIRAYVLDKGGKAGELAERAQYLANFAESLMLPFPIFCAIVVWKLVNYLHIYWGVATLVAFVIGILIICALIKRHLELRREWAMHIYREFLVITAKDRSNE